MRKFAYERKPNTHRDRNMKQTFFSAAALILCALAWVCPSRAQVQVVAIPKVYYAAFPYNSEAVFQLYPAFWQDTETKASYKLDTRTGDVYLVTLHYQYKGARLEPVCTDELAFASPLDVSDTLRTQGRFILYPNYDDVGGYEFLLLDQQTGNTYIAFRKGKRSNSTLLGELRPAIED